VGATPWDGSADFKGTNTPAPEAVTGYPGNARPCLARRGGPTVLPMDNTDEVPDFLTTHRERLTPDRAGIPIYGGRRRV